MRVGNRLTARAEARHAALRELGALVCHCLRPFPRRLGVWECSECSLCGLLIVERDAALELLERRAEVEP